MREKFDSNLNKILKEVYKLKTKKLHFNSTNYRYLSKKKNREYTLKEQQFKRQLDQNDANLEHKHKLINEKTIEIEHLKKQQNDLIKKYKTEANTQTEKLTAKENIIKVNTIFHIKT